MVKIKLIIPSSKIAKYKTLFFFGSKENIWKRYLHGIECNKEKLGKKIGKTKQNKTKQSKAKTPNLTPKKKKVGGIERLYGSSSDDRSLTFQVKAATAQIGFFDSDFAPITEAEDRSGYGERTNSSPQGRTHPYIVVRLMVMTRRVIIRDRIMGRC